MILSDALIVPVPHQSHGTLYRTNYICCRTL